MHELTHEFKGNKKGPVILFLHGFLGNKKDWYDIIPYLKDKYNCLLLDLPGHSNSKSLKDKNSYSIEHIAISIIKILDDLKIKKCYFEQFIFVIFQARYNFVKISNCRKQATNNTNRKIGGTCCLLQAFKHKNIHYAKF